jgi:hypothetical protein
MPDHRDSPPDQPVPPRRFVYRSAEPDSDANHPLRRSTDAPRPFRSLSGQPSPKTQLLKFRVYMKLN